jgi:hypothetical protein
MIIIAKDLALANLYRFASCAEYIDAHFVVILANGNKFKSCIYIYIYIVICSTMGSHPTFMQEGTSECFFLGCVVQKFNPSKTAFLRSISTLSIIVLRR